MISWHQQHGLPKAPQWHIISWAALVLVHCLPNVVLLCNKLLAARLSVQEWQHLHSHWVQPLHLQYKSRSLQPPKNGLMIKIKLNGNWNATFRLPNQHLALPQPLPFQEQVLHSDSLTLVAQLVQLQSLQTPKTVHLPLITVPKMWSFKTSLVLQIRCSLWVPIINSAQISDVWH